jgi:hypothetical protein
MIKPEQSLAPNVHSDHFPNVHYLLDSPQWLLRKTNEQVSINQQTLHLPWNLFSELLHVHVIVALNPQHPDNTPWTSLLGS